MHLHRPFISLLIISLLLSSIPLANLQAKIYVWIDENGNKVYGDEPQKSDKAEPVELEPLTVLGFPKQDFNSEEDQPQTPQTNLYTSFIITSPTNDSTIRDNNGNVSISLSSEPDLVKGHKVQIYIDGSPYQSAQSSMTFTLNNIDRGTHSLSARLIDQTEQTLMQSKTLTFHLHRFINKK